MILQALHEYYQRAGVYPNGSMAPDGFDWKEIPFVCHISSKGDFVSFEDTRQPVGNKKIGKTFMVPSLGEAKGNGIKANLLWENAEYIFGVATSESSKQDRLQLQADAFKARISKH